MYGCCNFEGPEKLIRSLLDDLLSGRVEIDMFRISGPNFDHIDNRLMALRLVKNGLTKLGMFGPTGDVMQPSEALHNKNVLVLRGRFRPPTKVNVDMLESGVAQFKNEPDVDAKSLLALVELTLADLQFGDEIDEEDFMHRADILCSMGQHVIISNYQEHYRLVGFLTRITRGRKIGLVIGINNLARIFDESYYENLNGGIMESFGTLFGTNIKLYVYPSKGAKKGEYITCDNVEVPEHLTELYRYLIRNNKLADIKDFSPDHLHIISDIVLAMIKSGEKGWETMVPEVVVQAIKDKKLFLYEPPEVKIASKAS